MRSRRIPVAAAGLAVVAAVLAAAGPAAAAPAARAHLVAPARPAARVHAAAPARLAAARSAPACTAAQLRFSVPAALPGDPTEGMGNRSWAIVATQMSGPACTITGWFRLQARIPGKGAAPARFTDAAFSNLGPVPKRAVLLHHGQRAVAAVTGAAAVHGCVTRWQLRLTLPAGGRPVTVAGPGGAFPPCLGGTLRLAPVQSERSLQRSVRNLAAAAPAAQRRTARAALPASAGTCRPGAVRLTVGSVTRSAGGTLLLLRLRSGGGACVLPESWPTVRLGRASGGGAVAKALESPGIMAAAADALTRYPHGAGQATGLALHRSAAITVPVLLPGRGATACTPVRVATVYRSAIAAGPGLHVALPRALRLCGMPRVLPFLHSAPKAAGLQARVLRLAQTAQPAVTAGGWAGFWRGTDSSYPYACGTSVPYREPRGDCSNGTAGYYGAYIGEVGSFQRWQGCGSGLNWLQGNYDAAQANAVAGKGLGAAAYWFAAGPGRDPHYDGSTAEAARWGTRQAERVARTDLGQGFDFPFVFMDIENNGSPPDENGWNTIWTGPCSASIRGGYISPSVDLADEQAFTSWIYHNTSYFAGIYSAGIRGYASWGGIFGSGNPSGASEWTFGNETSAVDTFPYRFSVGSTKAAFFSDERFGCALLWQWSGGNGVLNRYGGDLDQIDANHIDLCLGRGSAPPKRHHR